MVAPTKERSFFYSRGEMGFMQRIILVFAQEMFLVKTRIKVCPIFFFNLETISSQIFHDSSTASRSRYSPRLDKFKRHTVI